MSSYNRTTLMGNMTAGEVVSISSGAVGYSGNVGFGVPRDVIEKFVQVYWILR